MPDAELSDLRGGFPALRNQVYLSICDKMILHNAVGAAVGDFLGKLALASASRTEHEEKVLAAREGFAALMGVRPAEVAAARNVSDGINAVAWALDWAEGDNAVVCLGLEHPNNVYPWLRLRRRGVELRAVPARDGRLDHGAMAAAMDARTRLVSCASVSFAPGFRADLSRIGAAARRHGALFLVDGVQSAGILRHDLQAEGVDAFATSTSKGLLGLYGFGFLFVSERWIDRLEPAYLSRPAVAAESDDASALGPLDYRLRPGAGRFEVGSHNLAGAYAAAAALDLLARAGAEAVERRALAVAARLREGLAALGLGDVQRGPPEALSHLVTAGPLDAGGHGVTTTPWVARASEALTEARVAHTVRRGQLRFGAHAYNTEADAEIAVRVVADSLRGAGPARRRA